MIDTTAVLSHLASTVRPLHSLPHSTVATTIGTSSLAVMCHCSVWPSHGSWNHREPQCVRHQCRGRDICQASQQLHSIPACAELPPHSISNHASLLSLTKCSSFFAVIESSISLLMKVLPALMTLHACNSIPIRDKRSRCLQAFLPLQPAKSEVSRVSLSFGRRSSIATVSMSMPKNVMHVAGPSSFAGSGGRPSLAQVSGPRPSLAPAGGPAWRRSRA